jgi:hypothetical protein
MKIIVTYGTTTWISHQQMVEYHGHIARCLIFSSRMNHFQLFHHHDAHHIDRSILVKCQDGTRGWVWEKTALVMLNMFMLASREDIDLYNDPPP